MPRYKSVEVEPIAQGDAQLNEYSKIKIKVFVLSGKLHLPEANVFSAQDVENAVAAILAEGWKLLPGFPVYTGMEDVLTEKQAGFRLMFVFGK